MKFMLMMNTPRVDWDHAMKDWTEQDFKAHIGFMDGLNRELQADGVLVAAEGLAPPGQARLVRAGKGGAPEVTDGPFAEAKEFLAGFWIVDVESPAQAHAIAGRISAAPGPGGRPINMAVEVRQVMSAPQI